MDSPWLTPLADVLAADHTVVTTDPRGISRSTAEDPDEEPMPDLRADDLHHILAALDAGPAHVLLPGMGGAT